MSIILYQQAAQNVAGEPVSIEPDGLVWADSDHRVINKAEVEFEYKRLEQAAVDAEAARVAARESAIAKLSKLGLNVSEINAIVGGV
jgi:hypothetical protein